MPEFDARLLGTETPFASGAATYADVHPGWRDPLSRIYVKFRPGVGDVDLVHLALLDTGGHYCIFDQAVAASVSDLLVDGLGSTTLRTAQGPVRGDLYLLQIDLIAEAGEDLAFESVVFIAPEWLAPSYIGYSGALDRLRFAVDTEANHFYFGKNP